MREVKFRGLVRDIAETPQWVYGNLAILKEQIDGIEAGYYISNSIGYPFAFKVDSETVGQYIGINDKNGKEIYVNDILRYDISQTQHYKGIIKFSRYHASFISDYFYEKHDAWGVQKEYINRLPSMGVHFLYDKHDLEVIGTAHENPERLGGGRDDN